MLRTEIVRGLANLLSAVESSNVLDVTERVYRELTRQSGDVKIPEVLDCYQKFMLAYNSSFSNIERQVVKALDVAEFADAEWWSVVIATVSGGARTSDAATMIAHPLYRLRFAVEYLPNLITLLKRETDPDIRMLQSELYAGGNRPGHMILILPEEGGKFSSPMRVAAAIESVSLLYEAFAELNVQSTTDLVMNSCDSGLDKVFEFRGLNDVIEKVKGLLLDLWDNVIYYRDKRFADRMEMSARNLRVLADIAGLEEKNLLQKERAELLRRKFIAGTSKFFETGSSIPEMNKFSTYLPRHLLAPKETLLLQGRGGERRRPRDNQDSGLEPMGP
jgi:hypothetical protein